MQTSFQDLIITFQKSFLQFSLDYSNLSAKKYRYQLFFSKPESIEESGYQRLAFTEDKKKCCIVSYMADNKKPLR